MFYVFVSSETQVQSTGSARHQQKQDLQRFGLRNREVNRVETTAAYDNTGLVCYSSPGKEASEAVCEEAEEGQARRHPGQASG